MISLNFTHILSNIEIASNHKMIHSSNPTIYNSSPYCTKVFCDNCSSHRCPSYENGQGQINADSTVEISLTINLDVAKYMSYFCKNNKFGCKEILKNQAKLLDMARLSGNPNSATGTIGSMGMDFVYFCMAAV